MSGQINKGSEGCKPPPKFGCIVGEPSVYYQQLPCGPPRPQPFQREAESWCINERVTPREAPCCFDYPCKADCFNHDATTRPTGRYARTVWYPGECCPKVPPCQAYTCPSPAYHPCTYFTCNRIMNLLFTVIVLLKILRVLDAHPPNLDINRIKHLTSDSKKLRTHTTSNYVQSITPETSNPLKIYPARQDPRIFYQSAVYTKNNNENKANNEVSAIYPGRDVIRASDRRYDSRLDRFRERGHHLASQGSNGDNVCIRCPHDRTLVAKGGSSKVLLQAPRLTLCSGRPAPWNLHFTLMYGPSFGSLLEKGTHTIVGRITRGNTTLQHCKLQIDVILQGCHVPKYLEADCGDRIDSKCNFMCRDKRLLLKGRSSLFCGQDLKWSGALPLCSAPSSCALLSPSERGRISCQGAFTDRGTALAEGARCKIRCPRGWRSNSRNWATLCRQGVWSKPLTCFKRSKAIKKA